MHGKVLLICPTSQAKWPATQWHDGQISRHAQNRVKGSLLVSRMRCSALLAKRSIVRYSASRSRPTMDPGRGVRESNIANVKSQTALESIFARARTHKFRRCPLRSDTDRVCAIAANVAMGHLRSCLSTATTINAASLGLFSVSVLTDRRDFLHHIAYGEARRLRAPSLRRHQDRPAKLSPNIDRPLFESARAASSWSTSQCSANTRPRCAQYRGLSSFSAVRCRRSGRGRSRNRLRPRSHPAHI